MFERTGFDMKFLADIHTIATSLETISKAIVKSPADFVDVCPHCNTEIHYSLRNVKDGMTLCKSCGKMIHACDWCLATHGIDKRPCINSGDDCPFEKEDENANEE